MSNLNLLKKLSRTELKNAIGGNQGFSEDLGTNLGCDAFCRSNSDCPQTRPTQANVCNVDTCVWEGKIIKKTYCTYKDY